MSLFARLSELPDGHAEQRHDFDKRFTNTYLIDYNKEVPEILLNRGLDGHYIHFRKKSGEAYIIDGKKDFNIEPFMPKSGYYNSNMNLLYMYKAPARQWKRSFCSSIYRINNDLNADKNNWFDYAQGSIDKKYVNLDLINNELFCKYALSQHFAVKPDLNLYYREHVIASLNFKRMEVQLEAPALKQELKDFFKHQGVNNWKLNLTPQE